MHGGLRRTGGTMARLREGVWRLDSSGDQALQRKIENKQSTTTNVAEKSAADRYESGRTQLESNCRSLSMQQPL